MQNVMKDGEKTIIIDVEGVLREPMGLVTLSAMTVQTECSRQDTERESAVCSKPYSNFKRF